MKKLFLHIGTHKTGSTSIQKFCEKHRSALLEKGLYYPDYSPICENKPYAHHQFAKAIAGSGRIINKKDTEILASKWTKFCLKNDTDLLISAEPMFRLGVESNHHDQKEKRSKYFQEVKNLFPDFEIIPIVVYRKPDSLIESLYRENVMTNHKSAKVSFERFIEKNTSVYFSYGSTVEILKEIFGKLPQVLLFEDLLSAKDPIEHSFLNKLGYMVEDLEKIGHVRKSLNNHQLMVKRAMNRHIKDEKESNRVTAWLKLPEIESFLNTLLPSLNEYNIWAKTKGRKYCYELARSELEKLRGFYKNEADKLSISSAKEDDGQELTLSKSQLGSVILQALKYEDYKKLPASSRAYRV